MYIQTDNPNFKRNSSNKFLSPSKKLLDEHRRKKSIEALTLKNSDDIKELNNKMDMIITLLRDMKNG